MKNSDSHKINILTKQLETLVRAAKNSLNSLDENGNCIACIWSGNDEKRYCDYGCPSCITAYLKSALDRCAELEKELK